METNEITATDKAIAEKIRIKVRDINALIAEASTHAIHVDLSIENPTETPIDCMVEYTQIGYSITKLLAES